MGAAAVLVLAGCGELPKPFAHSGANLSNPLLRLADGGGVGIIFDHHRQIETLLKK